MELGPTISYNSCSPIGNIFVTLTLKITKISFYLTNLYKAKSTKNFFGRLFSKTLKVKAMKLKIELNLSTAWMILYYKLGNRLIS